MDKQTVITIKLAWWFWFYAYGVILMRYLTGLEANEDKVRYWVRKALKVKVNEQAPHTQA